MKWQRRFNITLTTTLTTAFILLGIFTFRQSYCRTIEALIDLYGGFKYYFRVLFDLPTSGLPSVTDYSKVMEWTAILPSDFESFKVNATTYFSMLISKENFLSWLSATGTKASILAKVLTILLPCFLVLIIAIKRMYASGNTKHNVDTIPLRVFKKISAVTYQPTKRFICGYSDFLHEHSWIWISWAVIWAFHLNLASIVIEFFAYYFFFAVSFRADTIYTQFVKLARDLQPFFRFFPWWSLLIICYVLFERWRKKVALNKLRKCEAKNCGFINALPIVSMTCGSMGKRKTTMITDMALSQEVMFRQKAFEILQKADMKFPYFPWILFEKELQKCMEYHSVYNLATVKEWVKKKRHRYEKHGGTTGQLYFYNEERYGTVYNDGLKENHIFNILETYAQAYYIYVLQSSLIVSNYAIRTDSEILDAGNLPMWLTDFFSDNVRQGGYSHILDFDTLRLGKKVLENNPRSGSFEFGVVAITEIGKERGNNLELKEVKKVTNETNQKNDLFNSWLKMCRHSATVDNFPFIKVFTDEQRPESWGADARDLCDIVNIVSAGDTKLALPFYTIEDMVSEIAFNRFIALYYDFRYRRGDNTLLVHILKSVTAWLWKRNARIYNKYGYSIVKVEKERGTMDGKPENKKYFLMNYKIYRNRFTTDCFSDYFNDLASRTNVGLSDYIEYATEKASVEELKAQNSYFINGLYRNEEV
ncbi:MAG: hypothetical protein SPH07_02245 [Eubacteriales bacterium]|nr:hypothetical protein [Eubacteriales bacterium]